MKIDLQTVPFSTRGSYMAFSYLKGQFHGKSIEEGLYFRNVHGAVDVCFGNNISQIAVITPVYQGKEIPYTYEASPEELRILTEHGEAGIAYADEDTIVIKGNVQLKFKLKFDGYNVTYIQPWSQRERELYLLNCFESKCRYVLHVQMGAIDISQKWKINETDFCELYLGKEDGEPYQVTLEEYYEDWTDKKRCFDYEQVVEERRHLFETFFESMPRVPKDYEDAAKTAAYVDWVSFVHPSGVLKREAMYMSKNWMCNVWSWDHCFNALALAYNNPKEAWNQYMVMFDFQKSSGNLPDSINDQTIIHNFCKPPIHGWTLRKLMNIMKLDYAQLKEAYEKLSLWTAWWLNYRDLNQDGLCEYTHGNDSGWDNSTAFLKLAPVTLPDLAAFLIIQMDVLGDLAETLGKTADSEMWKKRSATMMTQMLRILFPDDEPVALAGFEMERVESDSLILYLPIILGEKLPENIRSKMIETIKSEKFHTQYGLATESPVSEYYISDGYWRGPIWAPSTMLILDGMMACGEKDYVQEVTHQFCKMVQKSGCAENYDALTGEGLRDRAYTWTASAMLVMAHEYLEKEA